MRKEQSTSQSLLASDLGSFRQQESIFIVLDLLILAVLFSLHLYFAAFWGRPAPLLVAGVGLGVFLRSAEWLWLRGLSRPLSRPQLALLTWASIALNIGLASMLALLTDKEDTPYFVLMVVAVLVAAFRFELFAIVIVVTIVDVSLFLQVWWFFKNHPPLDVGEYYEASITSLLFFIVGILVCLLLADLRRKEERLANNVLELERAREQLLREEKLAAMGRLSSAIAHEIRNPVAMIASSIATAKQLTGAEREEMFEIASADASRAHASKKGIHFEVALTNGVNVRADESQLQQALMNLLLNAVDASPANGKVFVRIHTEDHRVRIDVENGGSTIAEPALSRIFEPFFTTKPHGTGLGLAIARNIARAQGGDLVLSVNEPNRVCFSLILSAAGLSKN